MTHNHILKSYDDDLKQCHSLIAIMFGRVEQMVNDAMTALATRDIELAKKVIKDDKELNHMQVVAENAAIDIVALRAPVADDLRETIAVLKVASMVERMGDYAKGVAKKVLVLTELDYKGTPDTIDRMGKRAKEVVVKITDAYLTKSDKKSLKIWENDQKMNALYDVAYRNILSLMVDNPETIDALSHFLAIAKYLERIGDQASNIAETIHFIVTGENVEEMKQKSQ